MGGAGRRRLRGGLVFAGAASLALVIACSGKNAGSFPFPGPSCTTSDTFYGDACWACSEERCSVGCESTDCAAYFQCFCACTPGGGPANDSGLGQDNACQAACGAQMTSACASCRQALGTCQSQSGCSPSCGYLDAG